MLRYLSVFLLLFSVLLGVSLSGAETGSSVGPGVPTASRTLRDLAHSNGIRGGDLAEELGFVRTVDKGTSLQELGVSAEAALAAIAKLKGEGGDVSVDNPSAVDGLVVNTGLSIRELAHANDVNGMVLTHSLQLAISVDKDTPVRELGVSVAKLRDALVHIKAEGAASWSFLKYWLWPPLMLWALWWLWRGGIPAGGDGTKRKAWFPKRTYLAVQLAVVVLFGFGLGKAPNPMEGIVKVFKGTVGIYSDTPEKLLLLGYFSLLAIIGNKLICGWGCPFGALEELLFELPVLKKIKRKQLPFRITMGIRTLLFVVFILMLFGWLGGIKGVVIYHYVNPFNLFGFELALWTVALSLSVFLVLSLFVYRPFCQLVCPFGWYSWWLEKISLFGIRIHRDRCNDCGACAKVCPLEAAANRLAGKPLPADCFSCARCLRVCPEDAIDYGPRWRKL
jgi:NAD-dependent dihydropyrimidine dehydrogenase PreA subunit